MRSIEFLVDSTSEDAIKLLYIFKANQHLPHASRKMGAKERYGDLQV
jgi:hypothetical protein